MDVLLIAEAKWAIFISVGTRRLGVLRFEQVHDKRYFTSCRDVYDGSSVMIHHVCVKSIHTLIICATWDLARAPNAIQLQLGVGESSEEVRAFITFDNPDGK